MARAGVTVNAVKQAREALMARGETISIDAIRIELGNTGSKSTLHKHLKALEQDETEHAKRPSLSDELSHLIVGVAQRLENEANEACEALQAEFDDARAQWNTQRLEFEETIARLEQDNTAQQARLISIEDDNAKVKDALREADGRAKQFEKDIVSRDKEITLLSGHNASLEAKHKDACDALNHYRESVKQQRQEERGRFDNELATLQQSLREAKLKATQLQDNLTTAQSECVAFNADLKATQSQLKVEHDRNTTLASQLSDVEKQRHVLQVQCEEHTRELAYQRGEVKAVCTQRDSALAASKALEQDNQKLQGQLTQQQRLIDTWLKSASRASDKKEQ